MNDPYMRDQCDFRNDDESSPVRTWRNLDDDYLNELDRDEPLTFDDRLLNCLLVVGDRDALKIARGEDLRAEMGR